MKIVSVVWAKILISVRLCFNIEKELEKDVA
jgi:hypothetical protein